MSKPQLISLLKRRSLAFGEFRLASGKTSPYYIDARRTTMSAEGLGLVGRLGLVALREARWHVRAVGGLTLGADPVAYAIAAASRDEPPEIDAFTVRKATKEYGQGRRIEGCFEGGMSVVIVEDVMTTGQSALEAVRAVQEAGGHILGVLAVVDRQEGGRERIEAAGLEVRTLIVTNELGVDP